MRILKRFLLLSLFILRLDDVRSYSFQRGNSIFQRERPRSLDTSKHLWIRLSFHYLTCQRLQVLPLFAVDKDQDEENKDENDDDEVNGADNNKDQKGPNDDKEQNDHEQLYMDYDEEEEDVSATDDDSILVSIHGNNTVVKELIEEAITSAMNPPKLEESSTNSTSPSSDVIKKKLQQYDSRTANTPDSVPDETFDINQSSYERGIAYNWALGLCSSDLLFNANETIRFLRHHSQYVAFSTISGYLYILDKSTKHATDMIQVSGIDVSQHRFITAMDLSPPFLTIGTSDGRLHLYRIRSQQRGNNKWMFDRTKSMIFQYHSTLITALKIFPLPSTKPRSIDSDVIQVEQQHYLISTSVERKLTAIDVISNEVKYEIELPSRPLCMDFHGGYLALGLMNGKIALYNAITGDHLFDFQAHYDKIRSIHYYSDEILFSGSENGIIKRWDLASPDKNQRSSTKRVNAWSSLTYTSAQEIASSDVGRKLTDSTPSTSPLERKDDDDYHPKRFVDFYFQEAIEHFHLAPPSTSTKLLGNESQPKFSSNTSQPLSSSPTVEVKAQSKKVVSAIPQETIVKLYIRNLTSLASSNVSASAYGEQAVISLQGDDRKVVGAYLDGTISSFNIDSQKINFEIQGRLNSITTVQFDKE
eukprot:gene11491-12527_t